LAAHDGIRAVGIGDDVVRRLEFDAFGQGVGEVVLHASSETLVVEHFQTDAADVLRKQRLIGIAQHPITSAQAQAA